jgi:hypothetical protein
MSAISVNTKEGTCVNSVTCELVQTIKIRGSIRVLAEAARWNLSVINGKNVRTEVTTEPLLTEVLFNQHTQGPQFLYST